jgi:glycosyltransferase involved in cell wall biosynthesis
VRFAGFASGDRVRSAYQSADAVVFPVRWNEPFGLSPLEAMALGRPVVTTARGGTGEFVRDQDNALVFEADDVTGLASCVGRLGHDEPLRARLLEGGRRTAALLTAERFAELTVDEIVRAARTGSAASAL